MIRFRVQTAHGPVEISIDVDAPDTVGPLVYAGDDDAVDVARTLLSMACGYRGHIIGDATTPVDLHTALMELPKLVPELLEGDKLTRPELTELPDDMVT
jgi:hypothetical protein